MPAPSLDPSLQVPEPHRLLLAVLSSLPDTAVVVVDDDLVVRFACGPVLEPCGWDPAQVVGQSLSALLGERAALYEPHCRVALAGGSSTLEAPDGPPGTVYRTEFLALSPGWDSAAGAIAVVRNVSQQLEDRAALERSEREFRFLAENATDIISRHAMDSTCLYISPAITPVLGWQPAEVVGRSAFALMHPVDAPRATATFAELVSTAKPIVARYRMRHRNGRWIWVETVARQVVAADGTFEMHASARDINAQVVSEAANQEAQERFRLAFDDAPIGMALVDLQGRFSRVNTALCELLERPAGELIGTTFQELTAPEDLDVDLDHLRRLAAGEIPHYAMEKRYLAPDGRRIWTQLSVSLLRDADGEPQGYISQVQDIGERRRMQDALQHLADHDTLSGLWNRRRFEEHLRLEIARARRHGTSSALLLFDLDGLKRVNDTFGHQCGDELIRAVSRAVRGRLRETDAVARIGGDEFAVLLAEADAEAAFAVAETLCATVRNVTVSGDGATVATTISVGAGVIEPVGSDAKALLAATDRAMYAAKAAGGDRASAVR